MHITLISKISPVFILTEINPPNNTPEQNFQVKDKPKSPFAHDFYHKIVKVTDNRRRDDLVFPHTRKLRTRCKRATKYINPSFRIEVSEYSFCLPVQVFSCIFNIIFFKYRVDMNITRLHRKLVL